MKGGAEGGRWREREREIFGGVSSGREVYIMYLCESEEEEEGRRGGGGGASMNGQRERREEEMNIMEILLGGVRRGGRGDVGGWREREVCGGEEERWRVRVEELLREREREREREERIGEEKGR